MLVTSRDTGRWVLPKGNLMASLPPHRAAAQEAEEEAGVRGTVGKKPIGTYHYAKWRDEDAYDVAEVAVYAAIIAALLGWRLWRRLRPQAMKLGSHSARA